MRSASKPRCRMAHLLRIPLVLFAVVTLSAAPATAAWITIKNSTKQTILIQETGGPLNRPIKGKCIKLQPGEVYREFQLLGGCRNVTIYDSEAPNTPLAVEKFTWETDDTALELKPDGKKVQLATTPVVKKTEPLVKK